MRRRSGPGQRIASHGLLTLLILTFAAACGGAAATSTPQPQPTPTNTVLANTATATLLAPTSTIAAATATSTTAPAAASPLATSTAAVTGLQPCSAASALRALEPPSASPAAATATRPPASPATPPAPTPTPRPAPQIDRVGFPAGYQNTFKLLFVFDRPDNKQVRVICGNDLAASVKPGQPFPYGSVLVMETYRTKQDAAGNPVTDANGHYIREALAGIFVQRKEPGFGVAYGADRSGEWEYVGFRPDRSYSNPPPATNPCAACHLTQGGESVDYVFRMDLFFNPATITPPQPPANQVNIFLYAYNPARMTIKAGTTVTWINNDEAEHTVTAKDSSFKSPVLKTKNLKPGESFSYTFTQPGTYEYNCTIHPAMKGVIVVTP